MRILRYKIEEPEKLIIIRNHIYLGISIDGMLVENIHGKALTILFYDRKDCGCIPVYCNLEDENFAAYKFLVHSCSEHNDRE